MQFYDHFPVGVVQRRYNRSMTIKNYNNHRTGTLTSSRELSGINLTVTTFIKRTESYSSNIAMKGKKPELACVASGIV